MSKHKHNPKGRCHRNIVGGVLAAALALTIVVAAQVGGTDTSQFAADVQCWDGAHPDGYVCTTPPANYSSGGGTYTGGTTSGSTSCGIGYYWNGSSCQPSGGTAGYTGSTMTEAEMQAGCVAAGGTWKGLSSMPSCQMPNTGTATSCSSGQYWDFGTQSCKTSQNQTCGQGQYWDSGTNICKSSTYSSTPYPAGTCANGATYPAGTGTPPCGPMTGPTSYTSSPEEAACMAKGFPNWFDFASKTCNTMSSTEIDSMKKGCLNAPGATWDTTGNPPCKMPAPQWPPTTPPAGTDASKITGEIACNSAGYFWGTKTYKCYSTQLERSNAEGSTAIPDKYTQPTYPVETVDGCKSKGGTWNASSSTCTWPAYNTMNGMNNVPSDQWNNMPPSTAWNDCGRDAWWDPMSGTCRSAMPTNFDTFKNQFAEGNYECPEWDPGCKDRGFMNGEFMMDNGQAQCLNPLDAKRQYGELQREVKDFERQLKGMDVSQLSGVSVVAEAVSLIDNVKTLLKQYATDSDGCTIGQARELMGKVHEQGGIQESLNYARMISDFKREVNNVSREIKDTERMINEVGKKSKTDLSDATAAIANAKELQASLLENPPFDPQDPQAMWDLLTPECMKFGGPMGGDFGGPIGGDFGGNFGPPQMSRPCSTEELESSNTLRGYLELARIYVDESMQSNFSENLCSDAGEKIAQFEAMVAPQLSENCGGEVDKFLSDANKAIAACEASDDKFKLMPVFDKMRMRAEGLMKKCGGNAMIKDSTSLTLGFSGVDNLVSGDIMDRILALIEEKVNAKFSELADRINKVFNEKLADLATTISSHVLDSVTSLVSQFKNTLPEVANGLTTNLEIVSVLPEESKTIANQQTESTANTVESINAVGQISADLEDVATEALAAVTEAPLPVAVISQLEDSADQAVVLAQNGDTDGARETLQQITETIKAYDPADLNKQLVNENLWAFPDVKTNVWYGVPSVEAKTLGVVDGTKGTDGYNYLNPDKTLNIAEGVTMISKAAGLEPNEDVTPQVRALVGPIQWAGPYFQAMADTVGLDTLKANIAGFGMGAPMQRDVFAGMTADVYQAVAGELPSVNVGNEIGHYEDFNKMNPDQKQDFAVMHDLGIITGANNGTVANFDGLANRAEAAKMLTGLATDLQEFQVMNEAGGGFGGEGEFPAPVNGMSSEPTI